MLLNFWLIWSSIFLSVRQWPCSVQFALCSARCTLCSAFSIQYSFSQSITLCLHILLSIQYLTRSIFGDRCYLTRSSVQYLRKITTILYLWIIYIYRIYALSLNLLVIILFFWFRKMFQIYLYNIDSFFFLMDSQFKSKWLSSTNCTSCLQGSKCNTSWRFYKPYPAYLVSKF